ncbi:hypothetical protein GGR57DRAFT_459710 [Xylariaceae sp. FL1272]|nr:hypothetical protein GGR57DRAFT_459710 [Xylariaceae sp. FL1272]
MADVSKPVEVPATIPPVTEPAVETKPVEDAPVQETAAAETAEAPVETATEETPAAPVEETKKEEVTPIESGTLEHKGAPANFPKNLLYTKTHFWFGTDAVEKEKLATYLKNEKATDVAHHVVSWAAETGKGLFFFAKESDKTTPTGVIQLAEASEPTTDGTNKFHLTAKGHKHAFKATSTADRDNWVAQLKLKIAEAKELATTITESETYKTTLESLKPAKKEEKSTVVAATETPKEATEEAKEEDKKEEPKEEKKEEKKEEPKRRSASRKRASIFGSLLGKKDAAPSAEDKSAETEAPADGAVEATPIEQIIQATEPAAEAEAPVAEPVTEAAPVEETKEETKPAPTKRNSIFSSLSFGKKKAEADSIPATPAKEEPTSTVDAPVAETAPVIPAVETTEPLSAEVASPATVPTEATEATPATSSEVKKDVKSDKRKSSLPFAFGKKEKAEKSATSDEEGEKPKSTPFFSKFRQTVKKSKGEKSAHKPAEEATAAEDKPAETTEATEEAVPEVKADETKTEEPTTVVPAADETPAEKPAAAAPAPVTAAA